MSIQPEHELDSFYGEQDPWGYDKNPEDLKRKQRLLSILPTKRAFKRALDIGCGNGFLTVDLKAESVVGVDISQAAIRWAIKRAEDANQADKCSFLAKSVFSLNKAEMGAFDLIVITGVLYPQYINGGTSLLIENICGMLQPGGVLVSCHIDEWLPPRFPLTILDMTCYPYREFYHRLEVYTK